MPKTFSTNIDDYKQILYNQFQDPASLEVIDITMQLVRKLGDAKPVLLYSMVECTLCNIISIFIKPEAIEEFLDIVHQHLLEFELDKTISKAEKLSKKTGRSFLKSKKNRRRHK